MDMSASPGEAAIMYRLHEMMTTLTYMFMRIEHALQATPHTMHGSSGGDGEHAMQAPPYTMDDNSCGGGYGRRRTRRGIGGGHSSGNELLHTHAAGDNDGVCQNINILDTLTSKLDAFLEVLRVEALEQPCVELDTAIGICEYIQTDPANAPNSTAVKVLAAVNAVGGLNKDIHKATKEIVTMCLCRDIDPKSQGAFKQQLHKAYKGRVTSVIKGSLCNTRWQLFDRSVTAPPVEEIAPPVEEVAPPVDEVAPPVDEFAPPVDEFAPPVEDVAPHVEDVAPPVEDVVRPVEDAPVMDVLDPNHNLLVL